MSVICQTFVQNAWRSDLCSNCFKCQEEHEGAERPPAHRYVPQAVPLYQNRSSTLKWRLSEPGRRDLCSQSRERRRESDPGGLCTRGILVVRSASCDRRIKSRGSVDFAAEEALVIGYGGRDYDSDESPWEMGSDDGSIDLALLDDNDEDRKITRLTRNNTEFNSVNKNLLKDSVNQKSVKFNSKGDNKKNDQKSNINNNNNAINSLGRSAVDSNSSTKIYTSFANTDSKFISHSSDSSKTTKKNNRNLEYTSKSTIECNNIRNNRISDNGVNKVTSSQNNKMDDRVVEKPTENIQKKTETKKLEQFYFSEPVKSFLHGKQQIDNPGMNVHTENAKVETNGLEKLEKSQTILNNEFAPLNTKTYSFVSELNKVNGISEQNSDSDYSTCRLTAGDSTDSESLQEGDDAKVIPCPSFLHNNFSGDKKYDTGSSTSGDVSNLSDDSDTHDSIDVVPFKLKTDRRAEIITVTERVIKVEKEERTLAFDTKYGKETSPKNAVSKSSLINGKISCRIIESEHCNISHSNQSSVVQVNKTSHVGNVKRKPPQSVKFEDDTVSINVDSERKDLITNEISIKQINPLPDVCLPLDQSNAVEVSYDPKPSQVNSIQTAKDQSPDTTVHNISNEYQEIQVSRDSDESTDYERTPDDVIVDRQSKLAALALELELARKSAELLNRTGGITPSETSTNVNKMATSSTPRLASLPDVLQETPTKTKKSRFSLKKLLKRNKESANLTPKDPKAWKKQTFDRSRMSLDIVHPMDLEGRGSWSRARSLSALPLLPGEGVVDYAEHSETLPTRKAGTVAERKRARPSLQRTPSCSALPPRTSEEVPVVTKAPPPKPPPPPPPKHQTRVTPARPPPPKMPESKAEHRNSTTSTASVESDQSYANLGDIRSTLTPRKPERTSALTACRTDNCPETITAQRTSSQEGATSSSAPWMDLQTSYAAIAAANFESLAEIVSMQSSSDVIPAFPENLKWCDFTLEDVEPLIVAGNCSVFNATYRQQQEAQQVTLVVTPRQAGRPRLQARPPVLAVFLGRGEAQVLVLRRSKPTTLADWATGGGSSAANARLRDCCFLLLQLIHALKGVQAEGTEDICWKTDELLLVTHLERPPTLLPFLPGAVQDEKREEESLCNAAHRVLCCLLDIPNCDAIGDCRISGEPLPKPVSDTFRAVSHALRAERAWSLSRAKSLLEHALWGPVGVPIEGHALQRWLDLQRARTLRCAVTKQLHSFDRLQLQFLLQASVTSLRSVLERL